jgi:hypothetical protein
MPNSADNEQNEDGDDGEYADESAHADNGSKRPHSLVADEFRPEGDNENRCRYEAGKPGNKSGEHRALA